MQFLCEDREFGAWTDDIYANGGKVARAVSSDSVLTISGTNIGIGDYNWYPVNGNAGLGSYTVGAGTCWWCGSAITGRRWAAWVRYGPSGHPLE